MKSFIVCALQQILLGSSNWDEMGRACCIKSEMRNSYKILGGQSEKRRLVGSPSNEGEDNK
jgi:hypothetical protein